MYQNQIVRFPLGALLAATLLLVDCRIVEPEPSPAPKIVDVSVLEIMPESAILTAIVSQGDSFQECGFILSFNEGRSVRTITGTAKGSIRFTALADNLNSGEEYQVTAYIGNGHGSQVTSEAISFTTPEPEPEILNLRVSDITYDAAVFYSTVLYPELITGCGFRLYEAEGQSYKVFPTTLEGNSFSLTATELKSDCDYRVAAFIEYGQLRESVSDFHSFKTQLFIPSVVPEIRYAIATLVSHYNAGLLASVSNIENPQEVGFVVDFHDGQPPRKYISILDGSTFAVSLEGLTGETTYTFYAYVILQNGTTLKTEPQDFTTPPDPGSGTTADASAYIEDPHLLTWLIKNFDTNKDRKLSLEEAASAAWIDVNGDNVTSLRGIDILTGSYSLKAPGSRNGTHVNGTIRYCDISRNPVIETVDLRNQKLEKIILNSYVRTILLDYNELRDINVSSMKGTCWQMSLSHNRFEKIDLRPIRELHELDVSYNPCTELLLEAYPLFLFNCSFTLLRTLDLTRCSVQTLDCRNCPYLDTVYLAKGNVVEHILKDENTKIVYL